jgi:hypothetical protein
LNTYVFSVEDILSRASVKLARLKASDQKGYSHFSDDNPDYKGMISYVQTMYESAEALREEMRWQQDRLQEKTGIIAELGRKLKNEGDSLYPSDRVRLSAAIREAEKELKAARREVADAASEWEKSINTMQTALDPAFDGAAGPGSEDANVGKWLTELSTYGEGAVENRAPVALVNASDSRLGRMSARGSVLSNADSASVYVMTENERCSARTGRHTGVSCGGTGPMETGVRCRACLKPMPRTSTSSCRITPLTPTSWTTWCSWPSWRPGCLKTASPSATQKTRPTSSST